MKMILGYCSNADRIYVDLSSNCGRTIRCWFTARLVNACLPHFVGFSDHLFSFVSEVGAEGDGSHSSNGVAANLNCNKPIHDSEILVQAVDMRLQGSALHLTFRDEVGGTRVQFGLAAEPLCEWLAGLNSCVEHAGWSLEALSQSSRVVSEMPKVFH